MSTLFACAGAKDKPQEPVRVTTQALTSSPDTNCTSASYSGHAYWFCPTLRTWSSARSKCQSISFDLAVIETSGENAFTLGKESLDAWTGGTDSAVEGTWVWPASDPPNAQFWTGKANGHSVNGAYTNWSSGQPDDLLNQDCLKFRGGLGQGKWTDESCSLTLAFVCEGDLCKNDPNKTDPGQCGCGHPDTDTDGDGTADCNDGCPSDRNKTAPGLCGCGTADTDSDGDGALNCQDQCPNDAKKVVAGDCGCSNAPKPQGTVCDDGLCTANTQCDGQGTCGSPSQCGTPDTGCTFGMRAGTGYWFCNTPRSFTNAKQRCQNLGMNLVAIESSGEDAYITSKTSPLAHVYIGATDSVTEGTFVWLGSNQQFWTGGVNGTRTGGSYTNWESGQPRQDPLIDTDCVVKDPPIGGGQWEVMSCNTNLPFVCELNAHPECDDGNPCTTDTSQWNGTCTHVSVPNGTACDDKNRCTMTDTCQAGFCIGSAPISCDAAPHCGPAGTCDPNTGGCFAAPPTGNTGTDLRVASLEQMRLAAAKSATACASSIQVPLGQFVSGSVSAALLNPVVPDQIASALACGLDAAPGTTCANVTACVQGNVVPPSLLAICDGSALLQKAADGTVIRIDCSKFGGTCFDTEVGAICGTSHCNPGETYSCDGDALVACVHGVSTRSPCGRGLVCGQRSDQLIGCIGAGAACTGTDRCDGTRAVRCMAEATSAGHEAVLDCGAMGLSCVVDTSGRANCAGTAGPCDSENSPAKCVGNDLNVCVLNQWWSVGCSSLGATGHCVSGVGVNGEAGCR